MNRAILPMLVFVLLTGSNVAYAGILDCVSTNPANFGKCMIEQEMQVKNFYEANFKASLFDGSKEKACLKLYGNDESMYKNKSDPAALACALMVCGQSEYFSANPAQYPDRTKMCRWFRYMVATERDNVEFGEGLQDLKNYLSLLDLEEAKQTALRKFQIIPNQSQMIYSGVKYGIYGELANNRMDLFDVNYLRDSLFSTDLSSSDFYYVTSRLNNHCSDIEQQAPSQVVVSPKSASESDPDNAGNAENSEGESTTTEVTDENADICLTQGNLLPYDLMASSLHEKGTLTDKNDQDIAAAYIKGLIMPTTPKLKPPGKIYDNPELVLRQKTDPEQPGPIYLLKDEGRENLEYKFREAMTLTAAVEPYRRLMNHKMPVNREEKKKVISAQALLQGQVKFEEEADDLPDGVSQSVYKSSIDETLETESNRRIGSQEWFMAINTASKTALARESAMILATELVVFDKMLHHLDGISLLLAVEIAQMAAIQRNSATANQALDESTFDAIKPRGLFD